MHLKNVTKIITKNITKIVSYSKQDGNPYNGPSAIMVKVKPVGQDGQNGPVGQDGQNGPVGQDGQNGPVGQNGYPQDLYLYSDY